MPDATPVWPDDAVEVGRILDAHGIRGGLKVQPFAAEPEALLGTRRWFLQAPATPGPQVASPLPERLKITQVRRQGDLVVASAEGIADRNAAEALRGARIFVSRASFPSVGEGEYYWVDLIGLEVVNRQGERLGGVAGLLTTGPHCVLRITPPEADAEERMVPFVSAYVDRVDLPGRRITVDWGLDY